MKLSLLLEYLVVDFPVAVLVRLAFCKDIGFYQLDARKGNIVIDHAHVINLLKRGDVFRPEVVGKNRPAGPPADVFILDDSNHQNIALAFG